MCQLLLAIHSNDLAGLIKAIDAGARLSDRGFNAMDYAIDYQLWFNENLEVYLFLLTNHSVLITKPGAKTLLNFNNQNISKVLLDVLGNDESSKTIFITTIRLNSNFTIIELNIYNSFEQFLLA